MPKNAHLIEARYLPHSKRVRMFSHKWTRDAVTEPWNMSIAYQRQAAATLETLGYTIECQGEARHGYFFVVSEFIPLRDAAAKLRKSRKAS